MCLITINKKNENSQYKNNTDKNDIESILNQL